MKIKPLIGKFKHNNQRKALLTVVVQPDALYFSSAGEVNLPPQVKFDGRTWQETLKATLSNVSASSLVVQVVLDAKHYQTYQIDKPSLPDNELASALPFLLKDLISERVSDIVADSTPMPSANKLQVFVAPRKLVVSLRELLSEFNISLDRVLVEDEVWATSAGELNRFLLLQRSKQGQFKVSAFVDGHCTFQRTIRGVTSPLTGVASSALQLDGLALELQRSIDYLSSQLRSTPLHHMKVCCDDDDQAEVAQALSERLNVKVSPLTDTSEESGVLLAQLASQMADDTVDLYLDSLKPKKEYFSLKNVMFAWTAIAAVLLAMYGIFTYQNAQLNDRLALLRSQETEFKQQAETLTQRVAKHKPSPAKVAAVARLEAEIQAKRQSLTAINEHDSAPQMGYSGVMRSLAKLGRNDISLSSISINAHSLDLKGLAKEPQSIPNWISQFKDELNLVGRTFEKLKIGRNDDDIITFELKTKEEAK